MGVTGSYNVCATHVSAHDFYAKAQVVPQSGRPEGFVSLSLEIGKARIELYLPASACNAAQTIANLWPALGDPTIAIPDLSKEALYAILEGAELRGDVDAAEAAE